MVRPRKPEAERRSRTICVRVKAEEAAAIAERAGAASLTKGGCIRRGAAPQPRTPPERGAFRVRRGGVPRQPLGYTRGRLAPGQ